MDKSQAINTDLAFLYLGLRTDLRLCSDSDGGLVNAMIQGSVVSMCRSTDKVLVVLGRLRQSMG